MAGTLTISTLSDGTNSTSSTNCIQGSAKAWVNFNGVTTVTIRASYNVSSVTRNAKGDYTVNFTASLADANYSSIVSAGLGNTATGWMIGFPNTQSSSPYTQAPTSSAMRFVLSYNATGSGLDDATYINVALFR